MKKDLVDLIYKKVKKEIETSLKKKAEEETISLREYIKLVWPVIDGSPYVHNWHIDCLSDHLEALYRREIKKLIICIPPRMGKSQICSVCFPTWVWTRSPETQIYTASYSNDLCIRDSWKSRLLINSDLYQSRWGRLFKLREDSNRKNRYDNDKNGYRLALSTNSSSTGHGYDLLIIDDPHKATDVKSISKREAVIHWYTDAISTRANNPENAIQIVIGQRLHQMDLIGYLLAMGGWELLKLPMEYVPTNHVTSIGWRDPRTIEGELLFPERFNMEAVYKLKQDLGSPINISAQLQQEPSPPEGAFIKLKDLKRYCELPKRLDCIVASFDFSLGSTKEESSYAAAVVIGKLGTLYYVLDVMRTKGPFSMQLDMVRSISAKYKKRIKCFLIEKQGLGISIGESLKREYGITNIEYYASMTKDKVSRLELCLDVFENKCFYIPEDYMYPWVSDYAQELITFPRSQNDDQVDATTQALLWLKKHNYISTVYSIQQIDMYSDEDNAILKREGKNEVVVTWNPLNGKLIKKEDTELNIIRNNKQIRKIFD